MQAASRSPAPRAHRALPAPIEDPVSSDPSSGRRASPDQTERRLAPPPRPVRLIGAVRMLRRLVAVLAWTGVACVIQSVLLTLPGRSKARFARSYWSMVARLLGLRIRMLGEPVGGTRLANRPGRRPVIYVCNHSSWLDVPVVGGRLLACFVAKEEVGTWPLVGTVARLGRTLFVSRQRKAIGRERDDMSLRLAAGDDLILFPEGTSSDGSRVLPFHSSFFAAAKPSLAGDYPHPGPVPLIQPVSVVYDRLGALPVGRANRPVFAWYGDMDLASHFAKLGRCSGMRATICLHPVLDPNDFGSRKALSQAAWTMIADGAALLRQNRMPSAAFPLDRA